MSQEHVQQLQTWCNIVNIIQQNTMKVIASSPSLIPPIHHHPTSSHHHHPVKQLHIWCNIANNQNIIIIKNHHQHDYTKHFNKYHVSKHYLIRIIYIIYLFIYLCHHDHIMNAATITINKSSSFIIILIIIIITTNHNFIIIIIFLVIIILIVIIINIIIIISSSLLSKSSSIDLYLK